jgi:hypothetical protein
MSALTLDELHRDLSAQVRTKAVIVGGTADDPIWGTAEFVLIRDGNGWREIPIARSVGEILAAVETPVSGAMFSEREGA